MSGNISPINIFLTVLIILTGLGIFVPIFNTAFNTGDLTTSSDDILGTLLSGSNYLTIVPNLVLSMFWTFGLPTVFNVILIIPRLVGLIAFWYIVNPVK